MFSKYDCSISVASTPSIANAPPCSRSSSGPKTKLESGRGQHIHSTEPSLRRALYEQFPMMARPWLMGEAIREPVGCTYLAPTRRSTADAAQWTPRARHREQSPADPPDHRRHDVEVQRSSGGLSTALEAFRGDATWVGWPGARRSVGAPEAREHAARQGPPPPGVPLRRRGGGLLQRSATTRSGRSSTTSPIGCASRPRRGSATSR